MKADTKTQRFQLLLSLAHGVNRPLFLDLACRWLTRPHAKAKKHGPAFGLGGLGAGRAVPDHGPAGLT
jgi:hypothetical protein